MSENALVGNALCLDFANTVNKRPSPERDALSSIEALSRWAVTAGLPVREDAARGGRMRGGAADLAAAVDLREAVYRVFSAVASGGEPPEADVASVLATYGSAVASARLRREDSRFDLAWPPPYTIRRLTWDVAASAAELLLHGPLERVGECPACHWLFLDTSRGGRRRWCDMAVCGSRLKAQRYYANKTAR